MKVKTRVAAVLAVTVGIVCRMSGQQALEGGNAARNAFPVPATVRVVHDLVYAEYGERRLKLDLYLPSESGKRGATPAVIVVRGGGWRSGDKEAFGFIAGQLAKEGFVAASIEYRTSAEARFPAAVQDVKAAVRWMRAHASAYAVNPMAIGAIGGSAGAHLVVMLATSGGVKDLEGAGGNTTTSSEVQAVVAMACVCNMNMKGTAVAEFIGAPLEAHAAEIKAASPITYVSKRSAPLLLLHSQTDPVVPFEQSVEIERLYRSVGAPAVLKAIDAPRTHAFWNDTRYFPETIKHAIEFFRKHLTSAR
jgi:acetyl esterase/lipase